MSDNILLNTIQLEENFFRVNSFNEKTTENRVKRHYSTLIKCRNMFSRAIANNLLNQTENAGTEILIKMKWNSDV